MNLMDTHRKGYCAVRMTESPHEWTWTQAEQQEMARTVLDLDNIVAELEGVLKTVNTTVDPTSRDDDGTAHCVWCGHVCYAAACGGAGHDPDCVGVRIQKALAVAAKRLEEYTR